MIDAYNNWLQNHYDGPYYIKLITIIIKYYELVIVEYETGRESNGEKFINEFKKILELFVKLSENTFKKYKYSKEISSNIVNKYPQLKQILNKYNLKF